MTNPRLSWLIVAMLALGLPAATQHPTAPTATFKVDVNYVEVDAVVTDQRGEFVRDLRKEDFTLTENGRPQELSVISLVDIPIVRSERRASTISLEPDVYTNAREYDGRLYVLLLDDLHTDPLRSTQVRSAAERFVDRYLGPNDLAAVVHASGHADRSQYFSGNPRLLRAAIGGFVGRKARAGTLERANDFFSLRRPPEEDFNKVRILDPLTRERGDRARSLLERLRNISDALAGVRGRRKALVLVSEGIDYDVHDQFDEQGASMVRGLTQEAIAAANRAGLAIYALDPRGVTALGDDVIQLTELPSPEYHRLEIGSTGLQNELRRAQDSLRVLADETGGAAAVDTNAYATLFDRVVGDSSTYYLRGYYPHDDRRDGGFRKIDVRVRRDGLRVRARNGYIAPKGAPRDQQRVDAASGTSIRLREALQNPLPLNGPRLSTFAAAFKGDGADASMLIGIELGGDNLPLAEHQGSFSNTVEVSLVAVDAQGRVRDGSQLTVPFKLQREAVGAVSRGGLRLFSRLNLPPGRYQVRMAATEGVGSRIGSVHHDMEVPDFTAAQLALSGLVVTAASARDALTPNAETRLADRLPAPPTPRREFTVADALALFVEVYDNSPHSDGIDIVTMLRDEEGRVAFRSEQSRTAALLVGGSRTYGYSARVPVRTLTPGAYILGVEARARIGAEAPVARETQIRLVSAPGMP